MKKYIKPALNHDEIAMTNIMTASNGSAPVSQEPIDPTKKVEAKHTVINTDKRFDF